MNESKQRGYIGLVIVCVRGRSARGRTYEALIFIVRRVRLHERAEQLCDLGLKISTNQTKYIQVMQICCLALFRCVAVYLYLVTTRNSTRHEEIATCSPIRCVCELIRVRVILLYL